MLHKKIRPEWPGRALWKRWGVLRMSRVPWAIRQGGHFGRGSSMSKAWKGVDVGPRVASLGP